MKNPKSIILRVVGNNIRFIGIWASGDVKDITPFCEHEMEWAENSTDFWQRIDYRSSRAIDAIEYPVRASLTNTNYPLRTIK